MPAYSREASGWTQTTMRKRQDAAWSGEDALGFVREGGAWVKFQEPVGDADLLQPENLTATPTDLSADFAWTNPTPLSEAATPTHVQYRSATTTEVWTEEAYPLTATTFSFLAPETEYQFQVRYVSRVDGVIELTGYITEVFFTTTALAGPGTPAADPGGTGPDTTIPWGNTGGTPGVVGGSGCWWEYIVQTATTPASGAITWSDSAVTGSFDGDAGSLEIDFVAEGLTCGALARMKYRENCDGTPGDYAFGEAFIMQCDWDVACGDIPASTQLNTGLYSDANCLLAFPELCGTTIRDTIDTSIELGRLPGFGSIQTFDGPHTVYGLTTNGTLGKPTLAGQFGSLALLEDGDDFSGSVWVHLEEVPGGASGGSGVAPSSFPIVRYGRNVAISAVFSTTTTWLARVSWINADGAFESMTSSSAFSLDEYHNITFTMDANGTKTLYVDGVSEDTETDTTAMAFSDAGIGQDVEVYTNEFMRFRAVAAWDRVLSALEVAELVQGSYEFIPVVRNVPTDSFTVEADDVMIALTYRYDITPPAPTTPGDSVPGTWVKIEEDETDPPGVGEFKQSVWYKIVTGDFTGTYTNSLHSMGFLILRDLDLTSGISSAIQVEPIIGQAVSSPAVHRLVSSPNQSFALLSSGSEATEPSPPTSISTGMTREMYGHGLNSGDSYYSQFSGWKLDSSGDAEVQWNGSIAQGGGGVIINTRKAGDDAFVSYATTTDRTDGVTISGTTNSVTAPTLATGDLLVACLTTREVPTSVPAGFTLVASGTAPTEVGFTGRTYIYAGIEGTDFTYTGASLTFNWTASSRTIIALFRIESSSGAMSKTSLVDNSNAFDTPGTTEADHQVTLASVPEGSVIVTCHTCLYASGTGTITPDSSQTATTTSTRGVLGSTFDPQSGTTVVNVNDLSSSGHFGVTTAAAFGPA